MKKLLLITAFSIAACSSYAQDTLKHSTFTSIFDRSKHIPTLVYYTLTSNMLECDNSIARTNHFIADPLLPKYTALDADYQGSGYDRGHNMSAEDNECTGKGMFECFYFSNMFPQTPKLNRGVWKALENKERMYAQRYGRVKVFIGSYGVKEHIGKDSVVVPAFCWKVISYNGKYEAYVFSNDDKVTGEVSEFLTTKENIEKKTGLKIN